ncbi:MAG: YmdB family metallophosphoesterase [Treponema sp.]|jgi:metallophosphoesterase (TIGR00282 family)|nr:YmdB family metallophosphoesterase [Treponema sp.]
MNVLCVGDVIGKAGSAFFAAVLPGLKQEYAVDFVIANGENSDNSGLGITQANADFLLEYADVITTGNHCYDRAGEELYTKNPRVLHPANYPYTEDAAGCVTVDTGLGTITVFNLQGLVNMKPLNSPFDRADALLSAHPADFTIVDFHAESTMEKKALAFYLDGRVSAVFGTHTHVQTADEQILPKGSGYIGDAGMTGPAYSVIGIEVEPAVWRQRTHAPGPLPAASGPCMLNAVLFRLDDKTGLCNQAVRLIRKAGGFTDKHEISGNRFPAGAR